MSGAHTEIILIAAMARNGVIGRNNTLPWRLKGDLAHFKAVTLGHPVLMGRKTWESLGRPLPGRRNLVVTRDSAYVAQGAEIYDSLEKALQSLNVDKVFVIGGADIYRQLLDRADMLMLTEVQADVEGDAHFPTFAREEYSEISRISHASDAQNDHAYDLVEYRRKPA